MKNQLQVVFFIIIIVLLIVGFHRPAKATQLGSTTTIRHNSIESVNSGRRLFLSATVTDPNKIDIVRIYFKAKASSEYNFISLRNDVRSKYVGQLPAAAADCKTINYLILVKNSRNQIVKSQIFNVIVADSNISVSHPLSKVHIYTELTDASKKLPGFSDNFNIKVVEPSLRYGTVANLYNGTDTDTIATYGGEVTASPATKGISTTTLAVGGATFFSVAVGGLAVNYSSDNGDSKDENTTLEEIKSSCLYTGQWNGTWQETRSKNETISGAWSGIVDANCNFTSSMKNINGSVNRGTGTARTVSSRVTFYEHHVNGSYRAEQISGTFRGIKQSVKR